MSGRPNCLIGAVFFAVAVISVAGFVAIIVSVAIIIAAALGVFQ